MQKNIRLFQSIRHILPVCIGLFLVAQPCRAELNGYDKIAPDKVVFGTDNGQKMLLQFCSPDVIKVEYSFDGEFQDEAPTPAVINDALEKMDVNVADNANNYEIFTSALRVSLDKKPMRLRIYDTYQKLIMADVPESYQRSQDGEITCQKVLARDEQIYGLGEKGGLMNRRGGVYTMWNSDKPCYCIDEDPLYKSIPFFMSSKRYGIFFDNSWKSTFDFGAAKKDCYSISSKGGRMVYYIITGKDYKDILSKYIRLTGQPIMPPKWALGFAQCRGLYTKQKQALEVGAKFRELQFPCDIIYQDIGWVEKLQNFEWNRHNYSDPRAMTRQLKDMGFRVIVSQDPIISQNNREQWAEADSLGYFVKDRRTGKTYDMPWPWGGNCGVVDFTLPAVADWWGAYQQKAIDDGVAGFWTDMGEPAWSNEEEDDRLNMVHHKGCHAAIHNVYGLYWDRVVTEQFNRRNPDRRIFQMTRAAFSGMQRYCFSWTGDCGNNGRVTESWEQFAYQIPMMLSASLCGVPFITGDITGYCGKIDDYNAVSELYVRWMQFGLFTPLSRSHHEGDTAVEPWQFSEEALACARKAAELKYQLMPYIYTYAHEAYETGIPLMRAMLLEFPDERECRNQDFQFMFGPSLLVAPVTEEGARTQEVYLPKGQWYDWYTHELLEGGRYIKAEAPLDRIPLFVRAGSIIPTTDIMQHTGENPNAPIYLNVFPCQGKTVDFTLYEDDGESLGYQRGENTTRTFSCSEKDGQVTLTMDERKENGGYRFNIERDIEWRIFSSNKPKTVLYNGRKVKKGWDKAGGHFIIRDKDSR